MNSDANIKASNSGVVPPLFTLRRLLTEPEAWQPLEHRMAGRISPDAPADVPPNVAPDVPPDCAPKYRTATLSSAIDCSRATSCSTSRMATRRRGATDSLRSTSATTSSEVSSAAVKLRKLRITRPLSTTAKSDFVKAATGRLFSSVAKNVTWTCETILRYVGRFEESFALSAAAAYVKTAYVKTKSASSTGRMCPCVNIAIHLVYRRTSGHPPITEVTFGGDQRARSCPITQQREEAKSLKISALPVGDRDHIAKLASKICSTGVRLRSGKR